MLGCFPYQIKYQSDNLNIHASASYGADTNTSHSSPFGTPLQIVSVVAHARLGAIPRRLHRRGPSWAGAAPPPPASSDAVSVPSPPPSATVDANPAHHYRWPSSPASTVTHRLWCCVLLLPPSQAPPPTPADFPCSQPCRLPSPTAPAGA
jgi:hypothetical protein